MQEIWYPSTNKIQKDGYNERKKSIKFAKPNLLSVPKAEVKLSNVVGQHHI